MKGLTFFENSVYNEDEDKERDLQAEEADPSDSRSERLSPLRREPSFSMNPLRLIK